jgi:hypothetical protein
MFPLAETPKTGYHLHMGANARYKDSVFSFLFSDPGTLRELYGAIAGVALPDDEPVTVNTLSGVLYMDRVNDVSFEVGGRLIVLIEHQSTINPNMALRLLMYVGRLYEKVVGGGKAYSTKRVAIPRPEFYVLYNGEADYPDEAELRLSESYCGQTEAGGLALELVVRVININEGRNEGIARRSGVLAGYSAFIGKVRELGRGGVGLEEAIRGAVRHCLEHGILKGFFEKNATEVVNMLMTEWNWDDARDVWYEEGMEVGMEKGIGVRSEEIALNALAEGASVEFVNKITGLDVEAIKSLQARK